MRGPKTEGHMSTIDRQRITAVRAMEALSYRFDGVEWQPPEGGVPFPCLRDDHADRMRR
jgi:hypothetical protein